MHCNYNTSTWHNASSKQFEEQFHSADETTPCMLCTESSWSFRQASCSDSTPLQFGCSLDVLHHILLLGKAQQLHSPGISSGGFSSGHCGSVAWQDLLRNRGWWQMLGCKDHSQFHLAACQRPHKRDQMMHLDISKALQLAVWLLGVARDIGCPSRWLPLLHNQCWRHRPSDTFPHVSLAPAFVTALLCYASLHNAGYSVSQPHLDIFFSATFGRNWWSCRWPIQNWQGSFCPILQVVA